MSALTTHTYSNPRKEKEKKRRERNSNKRSKAREMQRARSLEEDKSRTPYARAMTRHIRDKLCSSQEHKPPIQSSNNTKSSSCTYASSPWDKAHSPWANAAMQHGNATKRKTCSLCPGRLDRLPWAGRPPLCDLTAWGAVRPPQETGPAPNFSKTARTTLNTFQMLPGAQIMHKLVPLVDNAWIKEKCKKFQHIASQIYKIHLKMLHMSKWAI
jgi:hypothetical protein